jgi:hypothetical protein
VIHRTTPAPRPPFIKRHSSLPFRALFCIAFVCLALSPLASAVEIRLPSKEIAAE